MGECGADSTYKNVGVTFFFSFVSSSLGHFELELDIYYLQHVRSEIRMSNRTKLCLEFSVVKRKQKLSYR